MPAISLPGHLSSSRYLKYFENLFGPIKAGKAELQTEVLSPGMEPQGCHLPFPLQALLKNRLLPPLLQTLFPIMAAEPPLGQLDPEDQDEEEEELEIGLTGETPKHFAVQVG